MRIQSLIAAIKCASGIWSNRIKQLKYWKIGLFFLILGGALLGISYLEALNFRDSMDLSDRSCAGGATTFPFCIFGVITMWAIYLTWAIGAFNLILLVVYGYTYCLKGLAAHLPWFLSLLIYLGLFLFARFYPPVETLLVEYLAHLIPRTFEADFLIIAPYGSLVAAIMMKLATAFLACMQVYVIFRLARGLYREGEAYKNTIFYINWSGPAQSLPGPVELLTASAHMLRERIVPNSTKNHPVVRNESDSRQAGTNTIADNTATGNTSPRQPLSASQKNAKDKRRRANRAARKARRRSR